MALDRDRITPKQDKTGGGQQIWFRVHTITFNYERSKGQTKEWGRESDERVFAEPQWCQPVMRHCSPDYNQLKTDYGSILTEE
jgi:hypothetical protein